MFFLIRSIFWLSIVFSTMSWTVDRAQLPPHAVREAVIASGVALAGAATDAAGKEVRAWCVKSPKECLSDASQLTALVAAYHEEGDDQPMPEPSAPAGRGKLPRRVAPKS